MPRPGVGRTMFLVIEFVLHMFGAPDDMLPVW